MIRYKVNRFFYYLFHEPSTLAARLIASVFMIIPDKFYLQIEYKNKVGKSLNLKKTILFSEKLQWLKLYNRKPEYTIMVDKVKVKKYVAEKIGKEHIIPTLGIWDNPDEINFNTLPDKFVLKCNHNSGTGMCICKDKSKLDIPKVKEKLRKGLKENYFLKGREWPYKNVSRKILAEELLEVPDNDDLYDYKFFCFNGEPEYCQVISSRNQVMSIDFFNKKWEHQSFHEPKEFPFAKVEPVKPVGYESMLDLARQLAKDIPFVRIDFYNVKGKIYFGEITFFPTSGFGGFDPDEWDLTLGKLIVLPHKS